MTHLTNQNPETLLEEIKQIDKKRKQQMLRMIILYSAIILIWTYAYVFNYDLNLLSRVAGGAIALAFAIGAVYYFWYRQQFSNTDYTAPLHTVVQKAEKRYRLFSPQLIWLMLAYIVALIGIALHFWNITGNYFLPELKIGLIIIVFAVLTAAGWWIRIKRWKKNDRPVWIRLKESKDNI